MKQEGRTNKTWLAGEMGITPDGLKKLMARPLDEWKYKYIKVLKKYNLLPPEE